MIKDIPIREYGHGHCFFDSTDFGPVCEPRVLTALFSYAAMACEDLGAGALEHACICDCFFGAGEDAEFYGDRNIEGDVKDVDYDAS